MKFFILALMTALSLNTLAQTGEYATINTNDPQWKGPVLYNLQNHLNQSHIECSGKRSLKNIMLALNWSRSFNQYTYAQLIQGADHISLTTDYTGTTTRYLFNFLLSADGKKVKSFTFQEGKVSSDQHLANIREVEDNLLRPAGATTMETLEMEQEITTCTVSI